MSVLNGNGPRQFVGFYGTQEGMGKKQYSRKVGDGGRYPGFRYPFFTFSVLNSFSGLMCTNKHKQRHSLKLGKKRRESSKRNYYIISPRVIIKAIIIKCHYRGLIKWYLKICETKNLYQKCCNRRLRPTLMRLHCDDY